MEVDCKTSTRESSRTLSPQVWRAESRRVKRKRKNCRPGPEVFRRIATHGWAHNMRPALSRFSRERRLRGPAVSIFVQLPGAKRAEKKAAACIARFAIARHRRFHGSLHARP